MDPRRHIPPFFAKYSTLDMAPSSKWTAEEDSILVEAVVAGTFQITFVSRACSLHGYQLDRGFVGKQSPNVFRDGLTRLAANDGFIR